MVLGRASDDDPFQRHVGVATARPAWRNLQNADNSAASIEAFVNANVKREATLLTDGHKSYPGLTGYRHDPRVVGKMAAHIVLPWIHRAFSLMRRWSLGTSHGLRRKHVDTYLNEFVFRYNRLYSRHVSFETLLKLAADKEPASYWDIIKRDNPRKSASQAGSTPLLIIRRFFDLKSKIQVW